MLFWNWVRHTYLSENGLNRTDKVLISTILEETVTQNKGIKGREPQTVKLDETRLNLSAAQLYNRLKKVWNQCTFVGTSGASHQQIKH